MSKITIPTEVWVELYAKLANWHVEDYFFGTPIHVWKKDKNGDESYTKEAQDKFNESSGVFEEIMRDFLIKEGEEI